MIPAGYGRIIGACSISGKMCEYLPHLNQKIASITFEYTASPTFGAYSMSKNAMRSLTYSAAQEWGPFGVTVNAYAPGPVETTLCELLMNKLCNFGQC